jgi:hypothetical protein
LDFSIVFPNIFKLSPKMLYLDANYSKNWGHVGMEEDHPIGLLKRCYCAEMWGHIDMS